MADDPSVQVVANAQREHARGLLRGTPYEKLPLLSAASPFKAGGRMGPSYYTDFPAGPVALRHVASLYVYPNVIKAVKLSGAQVREWLEMSAGMFRQIDPKGPAEQELMNDAFVSYNFDSMEGVSYAIDVTQPARYAPRGPLVAPQTALVRAKAGGTLLTLAVAEGSRVQAGQVLGRIDLADISSRVAERQANVEAMRAALVQADMAGDTVIWPWPQPGLTIGTPGSPMPDRPRPDPARPITWA